MQQMRHSVTRGADGRRRRRRNCGRASVWQIQSVDDPLAAAAAQVRGPIFCDERVRHGVFLFISCRLTCRPLTFLSLIQCRPGCWNYGKVGYVVNTLVVPTEVMFGYYIFHRLLGQLDKTVDYLSDLYYIPICYSYQISTAQA